MRFKQTLTLCAASLFLGLAATNPSLGYFKTNPTCGAMASTIVLQAELADFNGDTHPDLLTLERDAMSQTTVRVYLGTALKEVDTSCSVNNGSFLKVDATLTYSSFKKVLAADFNSDGADEIVALTSDYKFIVYKNDGSANFTKSDEETFAASDAPLDIAIRDSDGNGSKDQVLALKGGVNTLLGYDIDPVTFTSTLGTNPTADVFQNIRSIAIVDFLGADAFQDMVMLGDKTGMTSFFHYDAMLGLDYLTMVGFANAEYIRVADNIDIDGDQKPELLVVFGAEENPITGFSDKMEKATVLFISTGVNGLDFGYQIPCQSNEAQVSRFLDFDFDGDLDIVTSQSLDANGQLDGKSFYPNTNATSFWKPIDASQVGAPVFADILLRGDIDGDGEDDLVAIANNFDAANPMAISGFKITYLINKNVKPVVNNPSGGSGGGCAMGSGSEGLGLVGWLFSVFGLGFFALLRRFSDSNSGGGNDGGNDDQNRKNMAASAPVSIRDRSFTTKKKPSSADSASEVPSEPVVLSSPPYVIIDEVVLAERRRKIEAQMENDRILIERYEAAMATIEAERLKKDTN